MAGIPLGSSFRLTSPIPLLLNAVFADEAARFAAGQLRHTAWDYHQTDEATYWRIKPRNQCFIGSTPATQAGTWGTIADHWIEQGTGSGGGAAITKLTPVTITSGMVQSDGSVQVPLPTDATGLLDLRVSQIAPGTDTSGTPVSLDDRDWSIASGVLTIVADANVLVGDVLMGSYYTVSDGSSSPGSGAAGTAQAGQLWVDANGDNTTGAIGQKELPYATIDAALDAAIGLAYAVIWVGVGTFAYPTPAKLRSNLRILCSGQSDFNQTVTGATYPNVTVSTPTALVGGSVLQGTFSVLPTVKNFGLFNCGIDCGSAYCTTIGGSTATIGMDGLLCAADASHPNQSGLALRTNIAFGSITVLMKATNINFHAFLIEQCFDATCDNIKTWGGFAGFVSKTVGGQYTRIHAYAARDYGIIFKQNSYATSIMASLRGFIIRGGNGLALHNESGDGGAGFGTLRISDGEITGCGFGIKQIGANIQKVLLSNIRIDGTTGKPLEFASLNNSRISDVHVDGGTTGFDIAGAGTVIANITSTNCSVKDVKISSTDASKPIYLHGAYCTSTGGIEYGDNCIHADNFAYAVTGTATTPVENFTPPVVSDPSFTTPTFDTPLTGATYSAGTATRTAANNGTFDAGGFNSTAVRAPGAAARFGFRFTGAGSTNAGIALDERTIFLRVDQSRYGIYVIASSGNIAAHYQGDIGTDTNYVAIAGKDYFIQIGTDNIVKIVETSDRVTFTTVYTFPGTYTTELRMHISLFTTANPLTGITSQYIS